LKDYKRTRIRNKRQKKGRAERRNINFFSIKNKTFIYSIIVLVFVSASAFYVWKYAPWGLFRIEFLKAKNIKVSGNRSLSEDEIKTPAKKRPNKLTRR